jgi:hypothetical protein
MLSVTGMAPPDGLINNAEILVESGFLQPLLGARREQIRRYYHCLPPGALYRNS